MIRIDQVTWTPLHLLNAPSKEQISQQCTSAEDQILVISKKGILQFSAHCTIMTSVGFLHTFSSKQINISQLPLFPSFPFPEHCCLEKIVKDKLKPLHLTLPFQELVQDPTKLKFASLKLKDMEEEILKAEKQLDTPWFNIFSYYYYLW